MMFSPFGDYNDDGTPKRAATGIGDGQRVAPAPTQAAPTTTTTALPQPPVTPTPHVARAPWATFGQPPHAPPVTPPAPPASALLTYGQATPPAPPQLPAQASQPTARAETDDEYVARFMPPGSVPGTMVYQMQRDAILARRAYESDPANQAAVQQQTAESNALRAAQTGSMGMLVSGPMSTPVANPSEAFARFAQSGYTGAQALADGWEAGTGLPGWMGQSGYWNQLDPQGRMGAPYVNQAPIVPPPPPSVTPPVAPPPVGSDPYHPAGYTPGVAAPPPPTQPAPSVTVPGAPVVDSMRPAAPAPPARRPYNPTATPNIPGQPVTDFTYPVGGGGPPQAGGLRFGQQQGQRRGVSRRTTRDLGGND